MGATLPLLTRALSERDPRFGMLLIELVTRRRLRINGSATRDGDLLEGGFGASEGVVTLCLATFTVGIAIGSIVAARASHGRPNLALVPVGAALMGFAALAIVLTMFTRIPDAEDSGDFYVLFLGGTLGMLLMSSANHLLMAYLAVEMASLPSYALSGFLKGKRPSSEAALKYVVYGGGAAAVMLYGISLVAGKFGTGYLPDVAQAISVSLSQGKVDVSLAMGLMFIFIGLCFKLSAVPFHFWCPDVFEGASAEVDAFLSVASKAAAMVLLLRVGCGLGMAPEVTHVAQQNQPALAATSAAVPMQTAVLANQVLDTQESTPVGGGPLSPVRRFFVMLVAVVSIVTCTFGNLAAYGQTNIKRMLAYSTIAHAGFMMMAVAAAVALAGRDPAEARSAVSALLLYVSVYLFMNLAAFAIVAFLRNEMHSEEIADYAGLIRTTPVTAVMMTLVLVSLIGLPPLAGFWPKLRVLQSLYVSGGPLMSFVLVAAALNTAVSLVYYLRVAKTMCIDPEPDSRGAVSLGFLPAAYVLLVSLPVLLFGIVPERLAAWTDVAVKNLFG